jgi:hypothetical protein
MRTPSTAPDDDSGADWDPTSPDILRSLSSRENPPREPFRHVSGMRHPRRDDCAEYLAAPQRGSVCLPATVPLWGSDTGNPLDRSAAYGVDLVLPNHRRATHVMALGVTGSGKNVRVIDPLRASAILDRGQTVVSFSLKSTDHGVIRELGRPLGRRVVNVNFGDLDRSAFWNPLATDNPDTAGDLIRRFADAPRNPLSNDSEFWTQWTRTGMQGCWEAGLRSLPGIMEFFTLPYKQVIERLKAHGNPSSGRLAEFLAGGSHNAETVMASILGVLNSLLTKNALAVMAEDELRLERLFQRPTCLHVEIAEPRLETDRALVRVLARCVIDALIDVAERRGRQRVPATVFIDDLPSLGALLSVERLLTLRSREIGVVAGVQSIASLELAYGPAAPALLEAFANKVVLPGCAQPCAEYFSNGSGETLALLRRTPRTRRTTPVVMARRLLSSADIRSPQYEHPILGRPATLFLGDLTFQAYLQRFHEIPRYASALRAAFHVTGREKLRRRKPRAAKPGTSMPRTCRRGGARASDPADGLARARLSARAAALRAELGWCDAAGHVRAWWSTFQWYHRDRPEAFVALLETLRAREATVKDVYAAYEIVRTTDVDKLLLAMDALLPAEKGAATATEPPPDGGQAPRRAAGPGAA